MKITRLIDELTVQRLQVAVISAAKNTTDAALAERDAQIAALTARVASLESTIAKFRSALT